MIGCLGCRERDMAEGMEGMRDGQREGRKMVGGREGKRSGWF